MRHDRFLDARGRFPQIFVGVIASKEFADLVRDKTPPELTLFTADGQAAQAPFPVTGRATDLTQPLVLEVSLNGGVKQKLPLGVGGNFTFTPPALPDGDHLLRFTATDRAGNVSNVDFRFTIDTVAPTLVLETGQVHAGQVTLTGQTEPGLLVRLQPGDLETVADANGDFVFADIPVVPGITRFTAETADAAGNVTQASVDVVFGDDSLLFLQEQGQPSVERTFEVALGQEQGRRVLQIDLRANFDFSDPGAAIEDLFAVYLVHPETGQTLLDRGIPGTSLFSLAGNVVETVPGVSAFDGRTVTIDVTNVTGVNQGLLKFQLINHDNDTGSIVRVLRVNNLVEIDANASPSFPRDADLVQSAGPIDLTSLTTTTQVRVLVSNVRFDETTGRYTAEVRLRNDGPAQGRRFAVTFPGLLAGVTLANADGVADDGSPFVNFTSAIPPGGLGIGAVSSGIQLVFTGIGDVPLRLTPNVLTGGPNRAPVVQPIAPIQVNPGGLAQVQVQANDPDGDPIRFSLRFNGTPPGIQMSSTGLLSVFPTAGHLGSHTVTVVVSDGQAESTAQVQINVVADPDTTTRASGRVRDTNGQPVPGVRVQIGTSETVTAADGSFRLQANEPNFDTDVLIVRGDDFQGAVRYPFLPTKLFFLLPGGRQALLPGVNNALLDVILPVVDPANGQAFDPTVNSTIRPTNILDASLFIAANTLSFTGELIITDIPIDQGPPNLPIDGVSDVLD